MELELAIRIRLHTAGPRHTEICRKLAMHKAVERLPAACTQGEGVRISTSIARQELELASVIHVRLVCDSKIGSDQLATNKALQQPAESVVRFDRSSPGA